MPRYRFVVLGIAFLLVFAGAVILNVIEIDACAKEGGMTIAPFTRGQTCIRP